MARTIIGGGTVVTASDTFAADVWIENGKITALAQHGTVPGPDDTAIDAAGCYVIPGGIDCHTHMQMPFGGTEASDDFHTGTVAAAHGGTTTIVDFAIQSKGSSMRAGLDAWHAKAEGKAAVDYGFHMIMTEANPQTLAEMATLIGEGVTSFKMFMAYPGVFLVDDQQIFRAMLRAGELGALITMHAEIGLPIDVLVQRALSEGHTAPIYHALTRPRRPSRPAPSARSRWPRWPTCRCTWCTSRRSARSSGCARRETAGSRCSRRPVRSTCSSPRTICAASPATSGRARASWPRRRCGPGTTTITSGAASTTTTSRSWRPTTARSA